jgi:putative sterol carrier protein
MNVKELLMQIPSRVNPAALVDANTCFHFILAGDGGGEVTITARDGKCVAEEGLVGDAKCVVRCEAKLLMDIINKETNPQMAVFSGKLKISNLGEIMKYGKMLGMM